MKPELGFQVTEFPYMSTQKMSLKVEFSTKRQAKEPRKVVLLKTRVTMAT